MTPQKKTTPDLNLDNLRQRLQRLELFGLLAHWEEIAAQPWLPSLIDYEEQERTKRSLERRLKASKLGRFKPIADFDWSWPKQINRELCEEILSLHFVTEPANVIIVGQNGVGKTMIAKNIAYHAVLHGHSALFISASELLNDLAAQESSSTLTRRLRYYCHPGLLVIDELGYLASSSEHADLLFEIITRRYQQKPIIITTNKSFTCWNEVFPNAACVVALVDRLIHKAEILKISADSYREKEAKERSLQKNKARANRSIKKL